MSDPMWADDLAPHGVELRFERDHAHISLLGQVDLATGVALVDAATSAVARYERVELDLSGVTWIGDAGPSTRVKSANGTITVERARGDLMATTANGDLRIGCVDQGQVMLRTSLGRIELGIPYGTAAKLGLRTSFGAVRNGLDATDGPASGDRTVEVDAQTGAGDIDVVRALVVDGDGS